MWIIIISFIAWFIATFLLTMVLKNIMCLESVKTWNIFDLKKSKDYVENFKEFQKIRNLYCVTDPIEEDDSNKNYKLNNKKTYKIRYF